MKLYAVVSSFMGVSLVEVEAVEKPNSFKIVDTHARQIHRSVVRKTELGICAYYDSVGFGLTKEQAVTGYVDSRKSQIRSYYTQIRRMEHEIKDVSQLLKKGDSNES